MASPHYDMWGRFLPIFHNTHARSTDSKTSVDGILCKGKRVCIFAATIFGVVILLYLSLKSSTTKTSPFIKPRKVIEAHPVSFYLKQVTSNNTFMKLLTNNSFIFPTARPMNNIVEGYLLGRNPNYSFPAEMVEAKSDFNDFNIEEDVIVVIHIQKTGGTSFNRHLVEDLILDRPCNCTRTTLTNPCLCLNSRGHVWLFSWFTIGWPCGLHADWTELHECVDGKLDVIEKQNRKRRYFYVTLLRDPIRRYISEWRHQRQGHHWQDARLRCKGLGPSLFDVRPCFRTPETWKGVTFTEFLDCRENLATNRQTRMIADLTKCDCYHRNRKTETNQNKCRLKSAMRNIQHMSFFGIMEYQHYTQLLFENTFNLKFKLEFRNEAPAIEENITLRQFTEMFQYIELDIELYLYAKMLFMERVAAALN